jgi:hypothetical protein
MVVISVFIGLFAIIKMKLILIDCILVGSGGTTENT